MSMAAGFLIELETTERFFKNTTSVFEAADAEFAPDPALYSVAGHIAHVADSVEWFIEGAFGEGWDMDFEALIAKARAVKTLEEANAWLARAFAKAREVVGAATDASLIEPIADTRIMNGAPRLAVISGIVDHTAHHRGALAVYARLIGKVPPMPYGDV